MYFIFIYPIDSRLFYINSYLLIMGIHFLQEMFPFSKPCVFFWIWILRAELDGIGILEILLYTYGFIFITYKYLHVLFIINLYSKIQIHHKLNISHNNKQENQFIHIFFHIISNFLHIQIDYILLNYKLIGYQ